jgi:hypothetical protein
MSAFVEDGGLGVVRVKPLGAGGGGGEKSALTASDARGVIFDTVKAEIKVDGRRFAYPSHVIGPSMDQQALFDAFMPLRVQAFLDGVNVNVMAYGQTGSGKTHTMFGPPGVMAMAAAGEYGDSVCAAYGLFPRGLLAIFKACDEMRQAGKAAVLTASAVELSVMGNEDMLSRPQRPTRGMGATFGFSGAQYGISIDRSSKPPRLHGMVELPLEKPEDLRVVYGALATRNTAATLMNDSSSRSHCFAFLTLRVYDKDAGTIRTSRFQFVDLAGSERLKDAHEGGGSLWQGEALNGLVTNYSLMMLSACARGLAEARRKKTTSTFSFRTYMVDLVQLLQESMTGDASTACFVCLSQAPDNLMQSKFALDFGEVFAKLVNQPRRVKPQCCAALIKSVEALLGEANKVLDNSGGGRDRFRVMREAQKFDCLQQLSIFDGLVGPAGRVDGV